MEWDDVDRTIREMSSTSPMKKKTKQICSLFMCDIFQKLVTSILDFVWKYSRSRTVIMITRKVIIKKG